MLKYIDGRGSLSTKQFLLTLALSRGQGRGVSECFSAAKNSCKPENRLERQTMENDMLKRLGDVREFLDGTLLETTGAL